MIKLREIDDEQRWEDFSRMREFMADDNPDRLHVYETPALRYLIFTTVGEPISPYLAPDLARALDSTIRLHLPTRRWPHGFNALRITTDVIVGAGDNAPTINTSSIFFDWAAEEPLVAQKRIEGFQGEEIGRCMKAMLYRRPNGIVHVQVYPLRPIARF